MLHKKLIDYARSKVRSSEVKSYVHIAVCLTLIAVNVGLFIFAPKDISQLSVLVSNALTLLLTVAAFGPVNKLLHKTIERQKEEAESNERRQKKLQERISQLEDENRRLCENIDTRNQTDNMSADINFAFRLETMEFTKTGYVVKEDLVDDLSYKIEDVSLGTNIIDGVKSLLGHERSDRKIIYVHKHYQKVTIGLDFANVSYVFDGERITLFGVEFKQLHDVSSELSKSKNDVELCEIFYGDEKKLKVEHGREYDNLKDWYREKQSASTSDAIATDISTLCSRFTKLLQDSMSARHPNLRFAPTYEKPLGSLPLSTTGGNMQVRNVTNSLLMLTDIMTKTQAIDDSQL